MKTGESMKEKTEKRAEIGAAIAEAVNKRAGARWFFADNSSSYWRSALRLTEDAPKWLEMLHLNTPSVEVSEGRRPFLYISIGNYGQKKTIREKGGTFPVEAAADEMYAYIERQRDRREREREARERRREIMAAIDEANFPRGVSIYIDRGAHGVTIRFNATPEQLPDFAAALRKVKEGGK